MMGLLKIVGPLKEFGKFRCAENFVGSFGFQDKRSADGQSHAHEIQRRVDGDTGSGFSAKPYTRAREAVSHFENQRGRSQVDTAGISDGDGLAMHWGVA